MLVTALRTMLTVTYLPLATNIARLDTTTSAWLLELDSDSSAEDQCVAMIDVLKIMNSGVPAAEFAVPAPRLRLVRN